MLPKLHRSEGIAVGAVAPGRSMRLLPVVAHLAWSEQSRLSGCRRRRSLLLSLEESLLLLVWIQLVHACVASSHRSYAILPSRHAAVRAVVGDVHALLLLLLLQRESCCSSRPRWLLRLLRLSTEEVVHVGLKDLLLS